MTPKKRSLEDQTSTQKRKKLRHEEPVASQEVDFVRGGGTTLTALQVKSIRTEAIKEADEQLELFKKPKKTGKRKAKSAEGPADHVRIEHLNYKRLHEGTKILGQVVSVQPYALILSLPNQLFGHVPVTGITSQLTDLLEKVADDDEDESYSQIPDLSDLFQVGQYVRAVVINVHVPGSTDSSVIGKTRDDVARASRRVELSLLPALVNAGVQKSDLQPKFTISAAVRSIEDHGYSLDIGIPSISCFLSFRDTPSRIERLPVGALVDVTVQSVSGNGRACNVSLGRSTFVASSLSDATNASSLLPGALVQCLITAVQTSGINVQILGLFDGTIDHLHLPADHKCKSGKKIKARILYNIASTPPRFALSLNEHILNLSSRTLSIQDKTALLQESYPIGRILESAKVTRVESERGLMLEIQAGVVGFVHISHVSDTHLPSITTHGPWKVGSTHTARVTGYFHLDGLLQLSLKPSIIQEKFFQVQDIEVGQVVKGTIKKLTESSLFVSIAGNLDGVVWASHFADIPLKHPSKRFKIGAPLKCRVLVVDHERKRISLTAKKTLLDSTLPIISSWIDAKPGLVAHGTIGTILDKSLLVEFFNNIRAIIPLKEISDDSTTKLSTSFFVGKVVKVAIISCDPEQHRIVASIRQALPNTSGFSLDISGVEISDTVTGTLQDLQGENGILRLVPSRVKALISLNNLANRRKVTVEQLRTTMKIGDELPSLVVVARNPEKSFVLVATKPETKAAGSKTLSLDTVTLGQIVQGRVTAHSRHGAIVKLSSSVRGLLCPTDTCDDYEAGTPFAPVDSVLKASVVYIDVPKKRLTLSSRPSKMFPDKGAEVVDKEISSLRDLAVGDTVRGFVKNIAKHGLFVTIGREIDSRVQIRELFDDYVKEWAERFHERQVVKGRVLSIDLESKQVEMTFRSTDSQKDSRSFSLSDMKKGQKLEGVVKKIEPYGIFIQIANTKLSGLCHKSEISDNPFADFDLALHGFRPGDKVKAFILDVVERKIAFSLKPSHFDAADFSDGEGTETQPLGAVVEEFENEELTQASSGSESDDDEQYMDVDVDPASSFQSALPATRSRALPLQITTGFQWTAIDDAFHSDASDYSDGDGEDELKSGKRKKKKEEIEYDITADMQTKTPQSSADFDRLLLGSPNSSYLWIQYMSFQLQLSEVDKARSIAQRALQTIHFREEQEKLNVWVALLNLECVYGTEDSLETLLKSAARANDSKTIHLRMGSIFEQAEKYEKAEEQYKRTCKRFGTSSKVWTQFSEFYLKRGDLEESRKLLPRSLQSLEKRKHLKVISRFAQMEYKLGEPERGKTLFEGIVDSHPKRTDLWSIYIDMEAGAMNVQSVRELFDRLFATKMTSRKAKALFKKWLQLEQRIGDKDGESLVKSKAIEWTQQAGA